MDTSVSDPLLGVLLDGRYRVGHRLARGGMAVVYEAHDNRLARQVAVKVMHPSLADDDEFVSRFIGEAHSAAKLSHPHVVAVYDQGADQGHVFLVMELVRGRTLRDLIRDRRQLSPRHALEVLEPVLAALGAAHAAGLVHRDVKPENVLLSDTGDVKVADFGLARAVTGVSAHTTTAGVLMGTVAYLSPEQVTRGAADPRSDVYAAGILLFEMLTGSKPHDGETALQVAYRHVHDDVPPPSSRVPGLPAELDHLVARSTNRDPDRRPVDARRFLKEVQAARRSMSDGELDVFGPPLSPVIGAGSATNYTSHTTNTAANAPAAPGALAALVPAPSASAATMVVDLHQRTATPPGATRPANGSQRGDTGPLESPPRRRRKRGPWVLALIVLLAAVLSGAAWVVAAGPLSKTTTPGLVGMTVIEARAKARVSGLSARVSGNGFDEVIARGLVLRTDPARGADVDKNGTVGLILSKGPERYDVPVVVNLTEDIARQRLESDHLSVSATPDRRYSQKVAKGSVISTDPPAGTPLKRNTAVSLVVSLGIEQVAVPDVTGKKGDEAKKAIIDARLTPVLTEAYDRKVPAGEVVSQSPPAGQADKGSDVSLVISKGPPLVAVPELRGKSRDEAESLLRAAGLESRMFDVPGGSGTVISQSPGGGEKIPQGQTVTVYVF